MINNCMNGQIDMVITKSISRFARNTLDTLKYVRMLKERNIAVYFEYEKINILTERESKIILYSIEDKVLCIPISELKDKLRANILQNIVIGLLHIDESA